MLTGGKCALCKAVTRRYHRDGTDVYLCPDCLRGMLEQLGASPDGEVAA